jgi:hypothetical protein
MAGVDELGVHLVLVVLVHGDQVHDDRDVVLSENTMKSIRTMS